MRSFDTLTTELGGLNAAIDAAEFGFIGIIGASDSEVMLCISCRLISL